MIKWTTDWFSEKGTYLLSSASLGLILVDYVGGSYWYLSGKQRIGMNADTKENWEESRDIFLDPLYRSPEPINLPKED